MAVLTVSSPFVSSMAVSSLFASSMAVLTVSSSTVATVSALTVQYQPSPYDALADLCQSFSYVCSCAVDLFTTTATTYLLLWLIICLHIYHLIYAPPPHGHSH